MRRYALLVLILSGLLPAKAFAQRKLIEKYLSNKSDSGRHTSFIALPALGYAQETGIEFGALSITSFYTDRSDTSTVRTSTISAIATLTTKKQSNFVIKPDIWLPGNRYHFSGTLRYKNFPFDFYGTGDRTFSADKDRITQKLLVLTAEAEKQLSRRFYTGVIAGYEHYRYHDREPGGIYETGSFTDKDGGQALYAGLSAIFDSRNIQTYTTRGAYLKLSYSYAPGILAGDDFKGSLIKADLRHFSSLNKKTVLGFNVNYQTIQGGTVPFYLLPQLGNDQVMRGYYTGRYRDQNLLTAHSELRYRFIPRLGVAAFAGTGTVFGNGEFSFNRLKPNYGAGLRYFVDPVRGLTFRMDYAVGEKRAGEERQSGFYLSLAEAF